MRWIVVMVLIASFAAHAAEAPDGGVAPAADGGTPGDEELRKELEQSLQQDAAAKAAAQPGAGTAAPSGATAPASGGPQGTAARGAQSLNPDISAILDANAGYERRGVAYRNGDDPDLHGGPNTRGAGFTAQEVELALSAIVDPYFRGDIFLTIPNLDGLEVEEAFATTTSLPHNLQLKAGSFRSAFGRQNGQHLHVQDFTRRPLVNAAFLGEDGLRGPGAQVSWLAPLPFYLVLYGEAFSLGAPDVTEGPVASFGGGSATDLTYALEAKYFVPAGDEWSVYGGFNFATGVSPGFLLASPAGPLPGAGRRSDLFGADLYVKWKPPNVVGGYTSVAWQTEAFWRRLGDGGGVGAEWDGGLYSQIVAQVARSWFVGLRGDVLGIPASSVLGSVQRAAFSVTWQGSEFARVRAYVEAEHVGSGGGPYLPTATAAADPATSWATYLQLEYSIGAHGAHPF
ncbi:MAG: hypothetical protein ACJ79D_21405 [Myxococcales bacterium]